MNMRDLRILTQTRRHFLRQGGFSLGAIALSQLGGEKARAALTGTETSPLTLRPPSRPARAKSVIYLHMSGGPPQHELFDWKPRLRELHRQDCPEELLKGQRFAFIRGVPKLLGSPYSFARYGQNGAPVSELLPLFSQKVDEVTFVRSMVTPEFNHAPAALFLHTGDNRPGHASIGSWATYGLGSVNQNLPGFMVLISGGADPTPGISAWGSGPLPSVYQGVQCRSGADPILFLNNPPGLSRPLRRKALDALLELNQLELERVGDPETSTRIAQYELAYRMQVSVPEVMDIRRENAKTLQRYGAQPGVVSFANNCLLARRLVENGVRYVQLFDWGWDCHGSNQENDLLKHLPKKCREIDRPISALLEDLKIRGLLDETLVVWGGEFGRTPMRQEVKGLDLVGRDHHPHSFTIWLAGAGVKRGFSFGSTDELGYFVAENKVGVHDLQATVLHLLGLDPEALVFRSQGLNHRLIGPADGPRVVQELLS